jgi:hypothetical protein
LVGDLAQDALDEAQALGCRERAHLFERGASRELCGAGALARRRPPPTNVGLRDAPW